MHAIRTALLYFAVVFGTGFILGTARVLWLVPRVGTRAAELLELPLMLLVTVLAARWLNQRFLPDAAASTRFRIGALAAAVVLAADLAVGVLLRGMTVAQVFTDRDPVSGTAYYGLLLLFALMPWLLGRRNPP